MAFENTKSLIRSCVVSTKKGLTIRQLERDFEDLVGSPIPYQEHGFQSLDLFLHSIPDTVRLISVGGQTVVEHVADESVARIASLVRRQKGKPNKGSSTLSRPSRSKNTQPASRTNQSRRPVGDSAKTGGVAPTRHLPVPAQSGAGNGTRSDQPAGARLRPTPVAAPPAENGRDTMQNCSASEWGAGPTRRSRSVGRVGRGLLSTAAGSLSISTSDPSGGSRPTRAAPDLCPQHRPPRVCRRSSCDALHVCRLYVDGFCPNGDADCRWGHSVSSDDNQAALSAHQLETLPERELLWLVRSLLRQTAPVTAEEYRSQLAVCPEYAANARCGRRNCFQLHFCPRLVAGECRSGDGCRWSHRLADPENVMVLLRLRCAGLSEPEVLAQLARNTDDQDSESADSEGEPTAVDGELGPPAAVGGACSSGRGSEKTGGTGEDNSFSAAGRPSEQPTGVRSRTEQSAGSDSSGQKTIPTSTADQRPQACPASDGQTDKPAAPDRPPVKAHSKEEMLLIARTLDVCHHYGYPSKCLNKNCGKLHLCRFHIAGICPYAIFWCSRNHKFDDNHNQRLLAHHQLKLSQRELLDALRAGYLTRNKITDLERRFLVQMCRPYQRGHCKMGGNCTRLHICDGYVYGECEGSYVCGLSHNLNSQHNAAVIRTIGLHSMTANDIRLILENPVTAKAMWESSSPKQQSTASSGDSNPVSQTSGNDRAAGASPSTPPTVAVAAGDNTTDGLPWEGAEQAQAGTLPAEAAGPTEGGSGAGSANGGVSQSDLGWDGGDAGGAVAVHSREPAQQTVESEVSRNPGQQEGTRDRAEQADVTDETSEPAQKTDKTNGTSEMPQSAGPDQQNAGKALTKKQSRDKPAHNSKKVKPPPKVLTKDDMILIARQLDVCRQYFYPSKCTRKDCNKLHLCRFFIACKCTYAIYKCVRSHYLWDDPHNMRVLREHRLDKLSEKDVFRALRDGYLAENPVTETERRYLVQMCHPFQRGFCNKTGVCTRVHICDGYISGTCESSSDCGLSHNLSSQHNVGVIRGLGLSSLTALGVKAILENPVTAKAMWESSAPTQQQQQHAYGGQPAEFATASEGTSGWQADAESQDSDSEYESSDHGDSDDLPDDGPILCGVHASGRRCQRADCDGFHICGFYLANLCRRSDGSCPLGHSFGEQHNVHMMDVYGLLGGSPEHFQELLDQMTLRARITFSNEVEEKISMCIPFNSPGGCTSEDCCGRFHLCNRFLAGTCNKRDCDRNHDLSDEHNQRVREVLGLAAKPVGRPRNAWATDRDVVELIRAKLGVKPGVYAGPEEVEFEAEESESDDEEEEEESGEEEEESGGEEGSDAGGWESAAEDTKTSDTMAEPAADATKPAVADTKVVSDNVKMVSSGTKPDTDVPKPSPRVVTPTRSSPEPRCSRIAPLPSVCDNLIAGRRCSVTYCRAVHVCPHFLAGACRRQRCTLAHRLDTVRNRRALLVAGRALEGQDHDAVIRELYATSANVRRSQAYSRLRICISNNHAGGCKTIGCPFVHVCQKFVGGTCEENDCVKGHSVETVANKEKLRPLKLDTAPAGEILEMLRAVHGIRSVCN